MKTSYLMDVLWNNLIFNGLDLMFFHLDVICNNDMTEENNTSIHDVTLLQIDILFIFLQDL